MASMRRGLKWQRRTHTTAIIKNEQNDTPEYVPDYVTGFRSFRETLFFQIGTQGTQVGEGDGEGGKGEE